MQPFFGLPCKPAKSVQFTTSALDVQSLPIYLNLFPLHASFCLCKQKSGSEHFKNLEQHYFFFRRKCFIWISYAKILSRRRIITPLWLVHLISKIIWLHCAFRNIMRQHVWSEIPNSFLKLGNIFGKRWIDKSILLSEKGYESF